jgi:hypothetical protein
MAKLNTISGIAAAFSNVFAAREFTIAAEAYTILLVFHATHDKAMKTILKYS